MCWAPKLLLGLERQTKSLPLAKNLSHLSGAAESGEVSEASDFGSWVAELRWRLEFYLEVKE